MIVLSSPTRTETIDYPEQTISADMEIKSNDTSGDSSMSDSTSGGIKPWVFSISLIIPIEQSKALSHLVNAAQQTTELFEPLTWRITNDLANDIGVLQVCFVNSISIKKSESLHAYSVSFSLREVQSTAERKEERSLAGDVKINNAELENLNLNNAIFNQINDQVALA